MRAPRSRGLCAAALAALVLALPVSAWAASTGAAAASSLAQRLPASTQAALLLDSAEAIEGLQHFLTSAGTRAGSLSPSLLGPDLERSVGFDPFDPDSQRAVGLDLSRPRALIFLRGAVAALVPVADPKLARTAGRLWVAQSAPPSTPERGHRRRASQRPPAAAQRASVFTRSGDELLVSGADADAVARELLDAADGRRPSVAADARARAALAAASGPAVLWLGQAGPLAGAALEVQGQSSELRLHGLALAFAEPLLSGPAPAEADCAGAVFCLRGGLAPGLWSFARELLGQSALLLHTPAKAAGARAMLPTSGPLLARVDHLSLENLEGRGSWTRAGQLHASTSASSGDEADLPLEEGCLHRGREGLSFWLPCPSGKPKASKLSSGPAGLFARLDAAAVGAALGRISPFDAMRGEAVGAAFAVQLGFGHLLSTSGPVTLEAHAAGRDAQVELRWPLR